MGIFKKSEKETVPKITNMVISVNLTEIDEWIRNEGNIEPISYSKWKTDQTIKKFEIQVLPQKYFLFFHKNTNTFRTSLSANIAIDEGGESSYVLYWDWNNEYFWAYIDLGDDNGSANKKTIFAVPIKIILTLIRTGCFDMDSIRDEENIIEIEDGVYCSKVFEKKSAFFGSSITYTNKLFSLDVFVPNGQGFEAYEF